MTSPAARLTHDDAAPVEGPVPGLVEGPLRAAPDASIGSLPRPDEIEAFFAEQTVTRRFTDTDRRLLAQLAQPRRWDMGEILLLEGQPSDALYFVYEGAVEVRKAAGQVANHFMITRLERGALFGEMSFMDRDPVSATVRAAGPCLVLSVPRDKLEAADGLHGNHLRQELTRAVAVAVIQRLRHMSGQHVRALNTELEQARLRNEFMRFFGVTMVLFGIASLVQRLIRHDLAPTLQMLYSWGFLLLTLAPIAYFAREQRLPRESFGLTLRNVGRPLAESLVVGLGLAAVAVALRLETRPPGEPLATWGSLRTYSSTQTAVFLLAYGPHCLLQEFIGRGVIQGSLQRFVTEQRPIVPILMTSALFGIFHFYVSIGFAVLTFVVSLLFGWLYTRHRTLVGVTVAHYILGFASIAMGFN